MRREYDCLLAADPGLHHAEHHEVDVGIELRRLICLQIRRRFYRAVHREREPERVTLVCDAPLVLETAFAEGNIPDHIRTITVPGSPTATPEPEPEYAGVSALGLRVIYLRGGNLWSWTEAGGALQMTGTEDISSIRISDDTQLLAFMRGQDVWTVRMDGTDARMWDTQVEAGGALAFAPSGNLLAVSTRDHIDVLDLTTGAKTTVLTYVALPDGIYPEVIWTPDALGFKTVIPAPVPGGKAEMLFVFTTGTVASLAKFVMVGSSQLSPDGGYVIYAGDLGDGRQSLYLMDSSGATRPYGEASEAIELYGWLPDAKRFSFGNRTRAFLGDVGGPPVDLGFILSGNVRWVDDAHYLFLDNGNLLLGDMSGSSILLDSDVTEFDAVLVN